MADKLLKALLPVLKDSINEEERTIVFRMTTGATDRVNEVVDPAGMSIKNYQRNPVFLWSHNHDLPPIGKSLWIKPEDNGKGILNKIQFHTINEFAREIYEMYRTGFLNACSIGFIPTKIEYPEDTGDTKSKIARIYRKWELLELSGCSVGCNQEALAIARNFMNSNTAKTTVYMDFDEKVIDLNKEGDGEEEKGVCGKKGLDLAPENMKWDSSAAEKTVRLWAGGEELDWGKYKQTKVWVDPDKKETFAGYKLPFVTIIDGSPKAVWRGVASAMGTLLGSMGGVDIPEADRKPVYNFLASYYDKFDKPVPDFKAYTPEGLKKMEDDFNAMNIDEPTEDGKRIDGLKKEIDGKFEALNTSIKKIEKTIEGKTVTTPEGKNDKQVVEIDESTAKQLIKDELVKLQPLLVTTLSNMIKQSAIDVLAYKTGKKFDLKSK